ncbi:MBL fold metallo-hydrolase [Macrococcus equipercicus]|uniref:MBL fold metallo-hydrolase n=1 Tax=Macrococcus equipercicus TaxID=69967 RepID=UPI0020B86BA5|nr:MBL fold metallo-hydrolase [Macrococcus equipercicus]
MGSGSSGNCYRISDGQTELLLEAGINFKTVQKALQFKTSRIKGVLITHEHLDHAGHMVEYMKNGLDCYLTNGTANVIGVPEKYHHRLYRTITKEPFKIGTWTILPFDIEHDAKEPCGYLLKSDFGYKLLFVTDTYYVRYKFKGITHIMLEINYVYEQMQKNIQEGTLHPGLAHRIMKSHFSLEHASNFLQATDTSKLQEIHLIHLSNSNSNAPLIKDSIQKIAGVPVYIAGGKA